MGDVAKDRAAKLLKKRGSISSVPMAKVATKAGIMSSSSITHLDDPDGNAKPTVRLENTYSLGPSGKFPVSRVTQILKDVVESYLAEERYEPELCRELSKTISEVIRNRIKELKIQRFKVVALISIGMLNDQGFSIASRCLWDSQVDSFASYEFKNNSLFAVATIFGTYQD